VSLIANNTISLTGLAVGDYNATVSCEDSIGNIANATNVSFYVSAVQEESSSGGGGISNVDVSNVNYFAVGSGNSNVFRFGGVSHSLKVLNLTDSSATIEIRSEPVLVSLNKGESKIVSLGNYSLNVTLKNVVGKVAYFSLGKVNNVVVVENKTILEDNSSLENDILYIGNGKNNFWKWAGAIFLLAVIIFMSYLIIRQERKIRKLKK
jgi:hypothetical protein